MTILPQRPLTVLFPLEGGAHFHYFSSFARALCARGHRLVVLFAKGTGAEELEPVERFKRAWAPSFDFGRARYRTDWWKPVLRASRNMLGYRRYAVFADHPLYYKKRMTIYLPFWLRPFARRWNIDRFLRPAFVARLLRFVERIVPPDREIAAHLDALHPDVLVVPSSNVPSSTPDIEYLKAARAAGIPSVLVMMSWDSLEKKGITNVFPDRFLVWNETKAAVARREHEVPAERIRIVGSAQFDGWFDPRTPRQTRDEFCRAYGLRAEDPIVLYLCSSADIAGDERWLIAGIRETLDRASDPRLRRVQILVRPHPLNARHYAEFSLPGVVFGSRTGALPATEEAFQTFSDELAHSVATIGVNTSATLEALIAGKPGIAILADRYRASQAEAPYFRQLIEGGALYTVPAAEEIPRIMEQLIAGSDPLAERRERFVAEYLRPRGRMRPAGEAIADEVELVAAEYAGRRTT